MESFDSTSAAARTIIGSVEVDMGTADHTYVVAGPVDIAIVHDGQAVYIPRDEAARFVALVAQAAYRCEMSARAVEWRNEHGRE